MRKKQACPAFFLKTEPEEFALFSIHDFTLFALKK